MATTTDQINKRLKTQLEALGDNLVSKKRPWQLRLARRAFERAYVNYIVERSEGDREQAAKRLGIGFSTLKQKIRE